MLQDIRKKFYEYEGECKMRFRKISVFAFLFLLSGLALIASYPAEAHYLSIITNSGTAEVGETHTVALSFTHVLPTGPQYGSQFKVTTEDMEMSGENAEFDVKYLYKDGTSTKFDLLQQGAEKDLFSATLQEKGTVILSAEYGLTMVIKMSGMTMELPTKGFSKQILNAAGDGWSKTRVGYDLEIVPLGDLAGAKVGDTIEFKVIFDGSPLAGAEIEWADPASELYEDPEEGGDANLQTLSDPTDTQGVFSYTVTHAGLNALGVTRAVEEEEYQYASSLIFNSAEKPEDSDSGGCKAGLGVSSMIGLPILLASFLRRKHG
jgi:uncharacterized GH25 family protein